MKRPSLQAGVTLVELLLGLAIAALLMAPLAALFQDAANASVGGRAALDLNQDLRFALDRIAATVTATPPAAIPDAGMDMPDVSTWLAFQGYTVVYTVANGNLVENQYDPKGTKLQSSSVIAANVSSFRLSAPDIATGQPLVKAELTLAANGASASGTRTIRLAGPQ